MKKALVIALTLLLALGLTAIAYAADSTISWTGKDDGFGDMIDPNDTPPTGYEAFSNAGFEFGEQEISYTKDMTYTSQNRAGVIVEGSSQVWQLQAKIGGYKDSTGKEYLKGFTFTLKSPQNKVTAPGKFTSAPVASAVLKAGTNGVLGTAVNLCKGTDGLVAVNWSADLMVPAAAEKAKVDMSAIFEWNLIAG